MKMRTMLLVVLLFVPTNKLFAQQAWPARIKIMTLGVFHFNYPNLDRHRIATGNEVDVLLPNYQAEIKKIVSAIRRFHPTHIAIEVEPEYQGRYDSLYDAYLKGNLKLGRSEVFQIAFRLGKESGIRHLSCVDEQGRYYRSLETLFADSVRESRFSRYVERNRDSIFEMNYAAFYRAADGLPKSVGIIRTLRRMNNPFFIRRLQGAYFIGDFRYEEEAADFTGVDFETCRWYNRNLRIFRNIQRITDNPKDRILLIIGDGHLGLLNYFLRCSPEYKFVSPLKYLKHAG